MLRWLRMSGILCRILGHRWRRIYGTVFMECRTCDRCVQLAQR